MSTAESAIDGDSTRASPATVHALEAARADDDLQTPELYLNRELTWLSFNRRVLAEAEDERNPLLERLKFLAISASNLDEFFMKRIGGLKQQVASGVRDLTPDGHSPQWQIERCHEGVREQESLQQQTLQRLREGLKRAGIELLRYAELTAAERQTLRQFYFANVFPLITPLAIDPAHPFPFVSNLSLNLLIALRRTPPVGADGSGADLALFRVKVPVGSGICRFVRIGEKPRFVPLDEVVANNLDLLFPGAEVAVVESFRVTRNANTERDEEEADDLLALIESELRDRRVAPIVRLEVSHGFDPTRRGMLAAELGLDEHTDVFETAGILALRDLMELVALDLPALRDPPHHPVDHPRLPGKRNIFHIIRDAGSILLMHPYESFATSV